jgi:hypothetical protein
MSPRAMSTDVRSPRRVAARAVQHKRLAGRRLPETLNLTVAQFAAVGTERRPPRVACCFQLLPCGDQRRDEFIRSQPDVDAETLQPLLLLQVPKPLLRGLHAQAGLLLSGGDLLGRCVLQGYVSANSHCGRLVVITNMCSRS